MKIVLQKFIASSGFCSRRNAEDYIRDGKVLVNGKEPKLGDRVDDSDEVLINGEKIKKQDNKIYIMLNKPVGYTCTSGVFKNEENVYDLVPSSVYKGTTLHLVGRLDKNSRGLILLTNDGDLTQRLTHPKFEHEKEYIVKIKHYTVQTIKGEEKIKHILKSFKKGIDIGEGDGIVRVKNIKYLGDNRFKVIITEGKKRQIRRMFRIAECEVADLERVRVGKLVISGLGEGKIRKIKLQDII